MTVTEYLRDDAGKEPMHGTLGIETGWLDVCALRVDSGRLWAGDPYCANADDGYVTDVPPGDYVVEARGISLGAARRIARLRVRRADAGDCTAGSELGTTGTDSALIGVCDIDGFEAACRAIVDVTGDDYEPQKRIEAQIASAVGTASALPIVVLDQALLATMPFVPSGHGDGAGPVLELLSGGGRVGIELEFIPAGETY